MSKQLIILYIFININLKCYQEWNFSKQSIYYKDNDGYCKSGEFTQFHEHYKTNSMQLSEINCKEDEFCILFDWGSGGYKSCASQNAYQEILARMFDYQLDSKCTEITPVNICGTDLCNSEELKYHNFHNSWWQWLSAILVIVCLLYYFAESVYKKYHNDLKDEKSLQLQEVVEMDQI